MLVLSRFVGESVMIGDDVEIFVVDIRGPSVRLGVRAATKTPVHRREVYDRIQKQKGDSDGSK